jgi:CheY-like chemotaxis protein
MICTYRTILQVPSSEEQIMPESVAEDDRIKVLVVDDEANSRRTLCQLLQKSGYFCAVAANGAQALELVHSFHPHAIIMDLMMPVLDGFETTRRLKQCRETSAIPVLAVTAMATDQYRQEARNSGVDDFLAKPINLDELLLRLRHRLDHPGNGEQRFSGGSPL